MKDASVDAPSAATGAMAEEEDMVVDAGTTMARARSGATGLVRTAGRISLARAPGGISLVRIVLKSTPVFLLLPPPRRNDDHHQDEGAGGFQEPRAIACILGGAQAPASQRIFK